MWVLSNSTRGCIYQYITPVEHLSLSVIHHINLSIWIFLMIYITELRIISCRQDFAIIAGNTLTSKADNAGKDAKIKLYFLLGSSHIFWFSCALHIEQASFPMNYNLPRKLVYVSRLCIIMPIYCFKSNELNSDLQYHVF